MIHLVRYKIIAEHHNRQYSITMNAKKQVGMCKAAEEMSNKTNVLLFSDFIQIVQALLDIDDKK